MADAKGTKGTGPTTTTSTATNQTKADLAQLAADVKKTQTIMDAFAAEAEKTGSKQAAAAKAMAKVYQKIASEQSRLLDLVEEHTELLNEQVKKKLEIQKLEKEGNEAALAAAKKEERSLNEKIRLNEETVDLVQQELKTVKQTARELTGQVGIWEKIGKSITNGRVKLSEYLLSSERLAGGVKGLFKATRDAADIQIMSGMYKGMTGDLGADLITGAKLAMEYGSSLTKSTAQMGMLGISSEETSAAFKQFSTISGNSADRMGKMTSAAGALSKVLGVSMPESTNYIIEQQLKYNRTAEQSAAVLFNVYENTKKYNEAAGTQVMRAGDVVKVLFDISREGRMVVQEQQAMEKIITGNLLSLQAQGKSYQEALAGATMFVKKLSNEAPEWGKILSGRDLYAQIKKVTNEGGKIGQEMQENLDKASPGLSKRIEEIMSKVGKGTSIYSAERQIQELLQGTELGMDSMNDQIQNIIKQQGDEAQQAIKALFNISDVEAANMINQSNKMKQLREDAESITDPVKSQQVMDRLKLSAEEMAMLQDESFDKASRASFLQAKMDAEATAEIKAQKAAQEEIRQKSLDAAKARLDAAKAKGLPPQAIEALEKRVIELTGKPPEEITDQISKEQQAMQGFLGGGFINTLMGALDSPLGQIVTGIAGLSAGLLGYFAKGLDTMLLTQIAANTAEGGLGGKVGGAPRILGAGAVGLAIGAVVIGATSAVMGAQEKEQLAQNKKRNESTQKRVKERIEALKAQGGQESKIASLEKVLEESKADQTQLEKESSSTWFERSKYLLRMGETPLTKKEEVTPTVASTGGIVPPEITIPKITAEDIYKQPPMPSSIAATPVSPAPLPKAAEAATAAFTATPTTPTATGVTQTASLAPGAQGTDVILQTRLPIAQAVAANLMTMSQFGIARG